MKDSCVIKSNKYGLSLLLNPEVSFEKLVTDICHKFLDSQEFFGHAELIISMEGRPLTFEEQEVIIQAIELNSNIKIKLIEEKDQLKERETLGKIQRFHFDRAFENATIHFGNLSSYIQSDTSIVVLGDLLPDGEANAKGNIIVYGKLEGAAHAGIDGDGNHFILCRSFDSEEVAIGKYQNEILMEDSLFHRFKRSKSDGILIGVWDNELIAEPLKNGLLSEIVSRQ